MSELSDVIGGNTITASFTNQVKERSLMRYADAAARDASIPAPIEGSLAYLDDIDRITVFSNLVSVNPIWVTVAYDGFVLLLSGGTMEGTVLFAPGTQAAPGAAFSGDASTGMRLFNAGNLHLIADGEVGLQIANLEVRSPFIKDDTTGAAASVHIQSTGSGVMQRSTSARKYKSDIQDADGLADLVLQPVTFRHDGDSKDYVGFIADDMPDDRMIVYGEPDEVENYDLRAVVAVLAAKINRLEASQ